MSKGDLGIVEKVWSLLRFSSANKEVNHDMTNK